MKNGRSLLWTGTAVCVFALFCAGCKTASLLYGVDVNGMVYDFDNRPVAGYYVTLNDDLAVVTDITGRFTFEKVKLGDYLLKGESSDYEAFEGSVSIYNRQQVIYLRIPSFSQLIQLTDKTLEEGKVSEAEQFLNRAAAMDGEHIDVLLYTVVLEYRKNNIERAMQTLERVKQKGYRADWVDTFYYELEKIQHKERR